MGPNDSSVRERPRSTLLDLARPKGGQEGEPAASPASERADPLPRPGDPYAARARRMPNPQMTLFFVGKDYLPDGFSYSNLERVRLVASEKAGGSLVLVARFSGSVITEVTIEGRNLQTLCNDIGQHLVPWVWEHPSPKDFADDDATLIRKFSFKVLES